MLLLPAGVWPRGWFGGGCVCQAGMVVAREGLMCVSERADEERLPGLVLAEW